jgi:hypothetical protein
MHEIKKKLMEELYEVEEKMKKATGGKVSAGDLEYIHKLTDTIKNIDKIEMLEEDGGYSEESHWMGEGRMYGTSYGGNSYARGRRYAKRDSMGRYSRDDGYGGEGGYSGDVSYRDGGNSYRGGYSRGDAKEHMVSQLEEMMHSAGSEEERRAIKQCIEKLEDR